MAADELVVHGAREHNLKDLTVRLPRNRLICITGLSGSGKSSLAFDTIYAEGQRRYVESLSAYARQFLQMMEKPDVDHIDGLSPAISIDQKTTSRNPRSTVGTVTEIYDYLRLLYARVGRPHCPICGKPIAGQSLDAIDRDRGGARGRPGRRRSRGQGGAAPLLRELRLSRSRRLTAGAAAADLLLQRATRCLSALHRPRLAAGDRPGPARPRSVALDRRRGARAVVGGRLVRLLRGGDPSDRRPLRDRHLEAVVRADRGGAEPLPERD